MNTPTRFSNPDADKGDLTKVFRSTRWFLLLEPGAQEQVVRDGSFRTLSAGEALSRYGDRAHAWFGVVAGLLKWSATTADGRSVTLGGLTSGSWFGEGSLLHGRPVLADIVALRMSVVVQVPRETFLWLCETNASFDRFLLNQINERLHWFMGDFVAHRLLGPDLLVARALVGLLHPWLNPGARRRIEISQEEVAHLAGVSRQRCNRALRTMEADGLVALEYGAVTTLDLDGLRRLAGE